MQPDRAQTISGVKKKGRSKESGKGKKTKENQEKVADDLGTYAMHERGLGTVGRRRGHLLACVLADETSLSVV